MSPAPPPCEAAEPEECGVSYSQWKADQLNALFAQYGSGGRSYISAATVEDGMDKAALRTEQRKGEQP